MRPAPPVAFVCVIVALGSLSGYLYGLLVAGNTPLAGAVYGACISLIVTPFDRGMVFGSVQDRMRRWPTLVYIPASEAVYVVLVMIGFALGGLATWSLGIVHARLLDCMTPRLQTLVYALVISGLLVFVSRVRDLLGHSVFTNLLLGRYHRPVQEERVFLFLDLAGSTNYARRHGDLRAQEFLRAIFAAIAAPVRRHGGSIDDYVGDMAMITWPASRGHRNADCIRCVFAILAVIKADGPGWIRRFGEIPRFHAALHGGPVITAEIGVDRHKISFFGDVVNTTARLEGLCRDLDAPVVISAALLAKMPLCPDGVAARSLGLHSLRGLDTTIEVFGLAAAPDPVRADGTLCLDRDPRWQKELA